MHPHLGLTWGHFNALLKVLLNYFYMTIIVNLVYQIHKVAYIERDSNSINQAFILHVKKKINSFSLT